MHSLTQCCFERLPHVCNSPWLIVKAFKHCYLNMSPLSMEPYLFIQVGNFWPRQSANSLMLTLYVKDKCTGDSAALTCCFLVCSFRRTADSSKVRSWAGLWRRGGSLAAVMSSRCFRSLSLLACAESGDEPSEEWLSEDPDVEMSPLWSSLETQLRRCYLQITDKHYESIFVINVYK